jgi:large subunit ribosomal protein L21
MYAIIEDGSHQFRVREGDRIRVDRRDGEPGDELVFPKVLLITRDNAEPAVGSPVVDGAHVVGKIVNQFRTKKIIIQKFRRRKNVRRRNGHRQPYTTVQITSVVSPQ